MMTKEKFMYLFDNADDIAKALCQVKGYLRKEFDDDVADAVIEDFSNIGMAFTEIGENNLATVPVQVNLDLYEKSLNTYFVRGNKNILVEKITYENWDALHQDLNLFDFDSLIGITYDIPNQKAIDNMSDEELLELYKNVVPEHHDIKSCADNCNSDICGNHKWWWYKDEAGEIKTIENLHDYMYDIDLALICFNAGYNLKG